MAYAMGKIVTAQAKTVEAAIAQALEMIDLPRESVTIEIISNPNKRLLGFKKTLAEVLVKEIPQVREEKIEELEDFERIIDDLFVEEVEVAPSTTEQTKEVEISSVRIHNGELEIVYREGSVPTIVTTPNVLLYKNGEQVMESTAIEKSDEVTVHVVDEIIPAEFTISLIEHDMIALLTFTPGKKIKRQLRNSPFRKYLRIDTEEEIELFNDLEPQQIVDELKAMKVQQGIDFRAVQKVIDVIKPYEIIVAKGTLPVEGTDGDLEVHIEYEEFNPNGMERVDFREMNKITNVQAGQVIATHISPVEGTEGRNLLGKPIPVKKVRDILLRLGKNVKMENNKVITIVSGRPSIEWRDKLVKIEVNHEFNHPGEVDLESGNIRFEGDVRIGGNILPSMFVGATGSVFIGGSVSKATVHAVKEAVIQGNVLSSKISVGEQNLVVSEAVRKLKGIIPQLEQIKQAIEQVFIIRGDGEDQLGASQLKRLIYLLIEKKYVNFENSNKAFIETVQTHEKELAEEWIHLANTLYNIFINPLNEELEDLSNFEEIIEDAHLLITIYDQSNAAQSLLTIPYAINSELYCNGSIQVTTKGVYHTNLTAEKNITIQGVCRGGEIRANEKIVLHEAGSENPVKTTIRTSEEGSIKIGKAYSGTEIYVGHRKYSCTVDEVGVLARLNEEGELIIR